MRYVNVVITEGEQQLLEAHRATWRERDEDGYLWELPHGAAQHFVKAVLVTIAEYKAAGNTADEYSVIFCDSNNTWTVVNKDREVIAMFGALAGATTYRDFLNKGEPGA